MYVINCTAFNCRLPTQNNNLLRAGKMSSITKKQWLQMIAFALAFGVAFYLTAIHGFDL